ncbi:hypothetical protein Btru_059374 [Bulinus truncatus]|nr:hypothetical protein Btru_059374 [Bulinus truncatus]
MEESKQQLNEPDRVTVLELEVKSLREELAKSREQINQLQEQEKILRDSYSHHYPRQPPIDPPTPLTRQPPIATPSPLTRQPPIDPPTPLTRQPPIASPSPLTRQPTYSSSLTTN